MFLHQHEWSCFLLGSYTLNNIYKFTIKIKLKHDNTHELMIENNSLLNLCLMNLYYCQPAYNEHKISLKSTSKVTPPMPGNKQSEGHSLVFCSVNQRHVPCIVTGQWHHPRNRYTGQTCQGTRP